jgi:hypothetical protein
MLHIHPLLAVLGALLVLAIAYDGARTTLSASASGPITRRLSGGVWRLLLFVHRRSPRHAMLERAGTWIMLLLILTWVVLAWAGWTLLFCATPDAVMNSTTKLAAGFFDRVYFAGFTLTTLGVGDFTPKGAIWQLLAVAAAGNGLLLFTMSITYAIPIISGATEKRQLALAINTMGESPLAICRNTVGDGDFDALRSQCEQIEVAIANAGQQHLAYPILHYFHSADTMTALPLALARLDQTLTIVSTAHSQLPRGTQARIAITQRTIAHFMGTLQSAFIRPSEQAPEIPSLDGFAELDFFDEDPERVREALQSVDRQNLLHAYVRDDGWRWEAIWHADNADEAATGDPDERN